MSTKDKLNQKTLCETLLDKAGGGKAPQLSSLNEDAFQTMKRRIKVFRKESKA